MKQIGSVQNILKELVALLDRDCSKDWLNYFTKVLNDSRSLSSDSDIKAWARLITSVYRGMGSFNDLVLVEGWTALKTENDKLEELRTSLLNETMKLIEIPGQASQK